MKRKKIILMFAATLVALSLTSVRTFADSNVVQIESNSKSGITKAGYTATLDDGTVLGFYNLNTSSGNHTYFCGAISQKTEISIPDSVVYNSKRYAVRYVGVPNGRCDFDNAQSVSSLILPITIENIYSLPPTVKELHISHCRA